MSPRATQADIAREVGVSRALVSMALTGAGHVSPQTRDRILEAADRLGYARNLSAANLASSSSPVIGVILPNLRNPFFEDLIDALQRRADAAGLLPLLATASNEVNREELVMQRFLELRVRGVITVSPAVGEDSLRRYAELLPLVVIGEQDLGGHLDTVCMDEEAAARHLMEHLAARGWTEVAYIFDRRSQHDTGIPRRRHALRTAAGRAGLAFGGSATDEGITHAVTRVCRGVRSDRPGQTAPSERRLAIIGHNDLLASEIASAVRGLGLRVGVDVAVAGYDDSHVARASEADLTSMNQSTAEQAGIAVNWVSSRSTFLARPPRHIAMAPRLTMRSST